MKNIKRSKFRELLISECRICFEKFFDDEEKKKSEESMEKKLLFNKKLFGNLDFVGELYRRTLLPNNVIFQVFESLLGIANHDIEDLLIEGGVNIMNKAGDQFEVNTRDSQKFRERYEIVMNKFETYMNYPDETKVSNRIKMLIKNMFANKDSNWEKTKEKNKSGPKTKA